MKLTNALTFLLAGAITSISSSTATKDGADEVGTRIIGGGYASKGDYPWFTVDGSIQCGGSLVSSKHVLTAAHCADAFGVGTDVFPGTLCLDSDNCDQPNREEKGILAWTPHPSYDEDNISNDYAIITLDSESNLTPVKMDLTGISSSYTRDNKLWTMGFGLTVEGDSSSQPDKLKHVEVSFVPHRVCQSSYGPIGTNTICAADPGEGWEDSCQVDSGGPLFDKEKDLLVGVVSFGNGCANHGFPGVYAKISDQAEWIKDTICNDYAYGETNRPDFCDSPIVPAPTPSPTPPYRCNNNLETAVEFELITDSYPGETKVNLTNSDTGEMLGQLSFGNEEDDDLSMSSSSILRACILPSQQSKEACVDLTVTDDEENGIFVPGGFELHMDGIEKVWEYSNEEWSDKTYSKLCVAGRKAPASPATSLFYDSSVNLMLKLGILMIGSLLLY